MALKIAAGGATRNAVFMVLLTALSAGGASADFTGKVIGVSDGDAFIVLQNREQVKVRLVEIDAPEKAQTFGNQSKQALSVLIHWQEVRVVEKGQDRNRRTFGRIYRSDLDVNTEMVRLGMAWVYRKYASKKSTLLALRWRRREKGADCGRMMIR